jgi:rare lipoprotein A
MDEVRAPLEKTTPEKTIPAPPAAALGSLPLPERLPSEPLSARAFTAVGVGFWLQLGAFSKSDRAMAYRLKVAADAEWLAPMLAVFSEGGVSRLQAGPYASRDEAASVAEQVRMALKVSPLIVERR